MRLYRYRPVALVLLGLHLNACSSWRPASVSPPQVIEEEQPDWARITRTDGERLTLRKPVVQADSIFGEGNSVAISSIQQIEVRRFDAAGTFILVFLTGVVVGSFVYLNSLCLFPENC